MTPARNMAILCGACLASMIAGILVGRRSAPVQTRDRIVTVDREASSHVAAYVGHTVRFKSTKIRWKESIRWLPGGGVEKKREQVQDTASEESTDEQRTQSVTNVLEKQSTEERAPVPARPRFAVELMGGLTKGSYDPVGGASTQVRAGDWWFGVGVVATKDAKAAVAVVRREF